jgi:RNA polymerase sigma factor (sigma-70 family)
MSTRMFAASQRPRPVQDLTLRDVPAPETEQYTLFLSTHLTDNQPDGPLTNAAPASESFTVSDELLLRAGLPVAVPVGRNLPDRPDEAADPYETVVTKLEVGHLYRALREIHPMQSKVVRLAWGIGCERPHTQREVAVRLGISQATVSRTLDKAMTELRTRFAVEQPQAA